MGVRIPHGPPMRSTCRVLRFYFVCYFTGCCEGGIRTAAKATAACGGNREPEQVPWSQKASPDQGVPPDAGTTNRTVPAVLRPGGQKQSCGLFLGRGSANPSWPTNAQHLPGAAFFVLYGRAGVHARRKTSCTARSRFARCLSRIVGAACMRPVKRCTHHPFTVCMVFASHGRAGDLSPA